MAAPTPALIRAQIAAVLDKVEDAEVIGIRVSSPTEMGESLVLAGSSLQVAYSDSVLSIREKLSVKSAESPSMVLLTPLDERELGADVVARLARKRLFSIQPWLLLKERFRARWVDPRLVERYPWVATMLLESEPKGGFPPAPSGFIEADMAWRYLFESKLGIPGGFRDPVSLLDWAAEGDRGRGLAELEDSERSDFAKAVEESAGELSKRIFDCLGDSHGASPVVIGLVARVIFGVADNADLEIAKAAVRLERYVGGAPLDQKLALNWADASETVIERKLRRDGIAGVRPLLEEADALLRDELLVAESAHRSAALLLGYEQRLTRFAVGLQEVVESAVTEIPSSLWDAAEQAEEHLLARFELTRCGRMQMALRLAGWLMARRSEDAEGAVSFAEAATLYRREDGFADWARAEVWDGDPLPVLAASYTNLSQAAGQAREDFNERFGSLFANWSSTGSHDESVIPVEDVLARVAAPLAREHPILFAVIDGMGMSVYRELEQDLSTQGWVQLSPSQTTAPSPVISALPSVTEVSRASLLSGALVSGTQNEESKAFSKHPGLLEASTASKPPLLFHKGDLTEPGSVGLSRSVASALTDPNRSVVGVVINAVDDHLAKGEQIRVPWRVDAIRPLGAVLSAAAEAGRIVILVSDHGHVPEHQSERLPGGESERWRPVSSEPTDARPGEMSIEGPRVVVQGGKLIAPWSERLRFSSKKNGYHGGLSPQEIVIPLGIFSAAGTVPQGWDEVPSEMPEWWKAEAPLRDSPDLEAPIAPKPSPRKPKKVEAQPDLFARSSASVAATITPDAAEPPWIAELLASEAMVAQRKQAARTALSDDRIRAVLQALDERGGKLTRAALEKRLGVPSMRVGGVLSALRRLLNVDGYSILSVDESSDTVELNQEVLFIQFGLKEHAER